MTLISSSITLHRKAKDGSNAYAAAVTPPALNINTDADGHPLFTEHPMLSIGITPLDDLPTFVPSTIRQADEKAYPGYVTYMSDTCGKPNSEARLRITFRRLSTLKLLYTSYAEADYDYIMLSHLDVALPVGITSDSTAVAFHSRNSQSPNVDKVAEYTGITEYDTHFIDVVFRKDHSQNRNDDRGYIAIPAVDGISLDRQYFDITPQMQNATDASVSFLLDDPQASLPLDSGLTYIRVRGNKRLVIGISHTTPVRATSLVLPVRDSVSGTVLPVTLPVLVSATGPQGPDAVVYTIVPAATVVAEGTTDVALTLSKTVGATTTPVTYAQTLKDGIILTGEADAADHVQWTPLNRRLHVVDGMVYGNRYTVCALNRDGQKLATTTIGVTARGQQGDPGPQGDPGERGQDGTGVDIKGTAFFYYDSWAEFYDDDERVTGLYLVNGKRAGTKSVTGAYLYTYNAETQATVITSPAAGDCYLNEADGHLYIANLDPEHPAPAITSPDSPNGLLWRDAGKIRGVDGISLQTEGENLIFPHTGSPQKVFVDAYRGRAKLTYGTEYTCSVLASTDTVLNGKVLWRSGSQNGRFYYYLAVKAEYRGTDISGTIPFTVTVDGVEYKRNINVRTVLNGSRGYNGCLIRRSEWQPGKTYRNDSDYNAFDPLTEQYIIDEVTITDENQNDHAYLVTPAHRGKISGTMDEEREILIKPGVQTPEGSWNYDTDNPYYTRLQLDAPLRTPFADIKQAIIDYLQARQIVITATVPGSSEPVPYGAFGGGNDWPLWFGGIDWLNAVFRVNRQGHLFSKKLVAFGTQSPDGSATGPRVEIENGLARFFGNQSHPNITLGTDTNGCAILNFYDQAGNKMYDLGPNGLQYTKVQPLSWVVFPASSVNGWNYSGENPEQQLVLFLKNSANFTTVVNTSVAAYNKMYKFLTLINAGAYVPVDGGTYNVPYKMFDGSASGETDMVIANSLSAAQALSFDQALFGDKDVSSYYLLNSRLMAGEIHNYSGPRPHEYEYLEELGAYPSARRLTESDFIAGVRTRHLYVLDPTGHISLETNLYFQ